MRSSGDERVRTRILPLEGPIIVTRSLAHSPCRSHACAYIRARKHALAHALFEDPTCSWTDASRAAMALKEPHRCWVHGSSGKLRHSDGGRRDLNAHRHTRVCHASSPRTHGGWHGRIHAAHLSESKARATAIRQQSRVASMTKTQKYVYWYVQGVRVYIQKTAQTREDARSPFIWIVTSFHLASWPMQ